MITEGSLAEALAHVDMLRRTMPDDEDAARLYAGIQTLLAQQ